MHIVICSLNSQYIHSSLAPWCLLAGIEQYGSPGVTAEVIESTVNQPEEHILSLLLQQKMDVLAFCCYIWNIEMVQKLVRHFKERSPQTVIVLGGPEVSYRSSHVLLEMPEVSYINVGEGEYPFARLMNNLQAGGELSDVSSIPGLTFRRDDGSIAEGIPYIAEYDPPSPYTEAYFKALHGRIAYLETSRGCPFSCAFCLSGRKERVRFFDLDRAKRDILALANSGAQTVKLVDRTFNCDAKRAYELFAFIISQAGTGIPNGVCFHFEVAADLFNEKTLALLKTAPPGLIQMEAGLQSFHMKTLEAVTRKTDLHKLCANIRSLLDGANIHVHIDLIAGLPYEDWDSFMHSFDEAYALHPHMLQLGFLKFLYGSRLRAEADTAGYVFHDTPPYEIIAGPWLTEGELHALHAMEDALDRLYNSGRFHLMLAYILEASTVSPSRLFYDFGQYVMKRGSTRGITLDDYVRWVWDFFSDYLFVEPLALRDAMVCDYLRSKKNSHLPACLFDDDKRHKKLKRYLASYDPDGSPIRRGIAIMKSRPDYAVVVEYSEPNPITGWYPMRFVHIDKDSLPYP